MINTENYKQQTMDMYAKILEFEQEVQSSDFLLHPITRRHFEGRLRSHIHNWRKHVNAKNINGRDIDVKVNDIFKNIKIHLHTEVNLTSIKEDVFGIVKATIEMDAHTKSLNLIIEDIKSVDISIRMDSLRREIENTVRENKNKISNCSEQYQNGSVMKALADDYIKNVKSIETIFNRLADALDILEEL